MIEPPERVLLAMIRSAAQYGDWLVYHTHDSRRSERGFPDLVMVRLGECLAVEVKAKRGIVSAEQVAWIAALGRVEGIEAMIVKGLAETEALCDRLLRRRQ